MRQSFNPEMLTLARESRSLTQQQLSQSLGISQGELSKIESGLRIPSPHLIELMAKQLKYPKKFFFLPEQIRGSSSHCSYYRKRQSMTLQVVRHVLAIVNVKRIQISKLLLAGGAELESPIKIYRMDADEPGATPERFARMMRSNWSLPSGPVQNMVRSIEDAGGVVVLCDFSTNKIDAVSQWVEHLPPMFFVNRRMPPDRMRFTLAHELGHLVMHQVANETMESEADRFAAEFLMPAEEIGPHLHDLSLPRLASLKPFWKTSMNALLKRASDLGRITPRRRSYLWMEMGRHGYRTHEPVQIPSEHPTLVREIIDLHRRELGYAPSELFDLMAVSDDEGRSEYLTTTGSTQLRVVG